MKSTCFSQKVHAFQFHIYELLGDHQVLVFLTKDQPVNTGHILCHQQLSPELRRDFPTESHDEAVW